MNNEEDAGAFSKMGTFLAFFESRVLWMYNLDAIQIEDKEDDELEPYILKLYSFYRDLALKTLSLGSTEVKVEELVFLKNDEDTLARVASELVSARDAKIKNLERIGLEADTRVRLENVFKSMIEQNSSKMKASDYRLASNEEEKISHIDQIASLAELHNPNSSRIEVKRAT